MLIPWGVMTSHRKSMIDKSCWELTNIVLVIDTIHANYDRGEEIHMQIHYLGHLL